MANIALITNNILSDSGTPLTGVIAGSGTTNYLSKFTSSNAIGNSLLFDDGTNVGIGTATPNTRLQVNGITASNGLQSISLFVETGVTPTASTAFGTNVQRGIMVQGSTAAYFIGKAVNTSTEFAMGISGATGNPIFVGSTSATDLELRTNNAAKLTVFNSTGNISINSSTDGGYKLDVLGTTRIQNALTVSNPSYTGSGSFYQAANSTTVIAGGPASENITFGPSNRIFINAQQVRIPSGSLQIASTLSVGTTNATALNMIWANGSITAGSNIARGIFTDTTLVASANNDVLVGLDVAPTFTNGAFTGVINYGIRTSGDIAFASSATRYLTMQSPSTSGSGGNMVIQSASANTSGTGGNLYLYVGGGAGGPGPGKIYIGNNNGWDVAYVTGILTVSSTGPNTGDVLRVSGGGRNALTIAWDNVTPFMSYSLVSGRQSRFLSSSSYYFDNNFLIGTTTDAGFKLDVNGTARIQNTLNMGTSTDFQISGTSVVNKGISRLVGNGNGLIFSENMQASQIAFQFVGGGSTAGNSKAFLNTGGKSVFNINVGLGNPNTTGCDASVLLLDGIHNITSFSNTIIRGIYYNPTLTSLTGVISHRAIETATGDVILGSTSGNVAIGTTTLGTATRFTLGGSQTASSAIARGGLVNTTLVAAANSDVLVGLDITPTFTNGAFTNVSNLAIRTNGNVQVRGNTTQFGQVLQVLNTAGSSIFYVRDVGDALLNGTLWLSAQNGSNFISGGQLGITSNTGTVGQQFIRFTHNNGNNAFRVLSNSNIELNPSAGNVLVGTTTDAGYKLDVNGTARVQGVITGSVGSGSLSLGAASSNSQAITITGYFTGNGAISTANSNGRSFNTNIGGQGYGFVTSYNGLAQNQTATNIYYSATGNINLTDGAIDLNGFNFNPTIVSETGATIKAFSSGLNSASNHWNLYLNGTAKNHIAGNLLVGTTTDNGYKLQVAGNTSVTGVTLTSSLNVQNAAEVNSNEGSSDLLVYADLTSGVDVLYGGGKVKANIYTTPVTTPKTINPSSTVAFMKWYPTTSQGVFIDYVLYIDSGTQMRSGTVTIVNDTSGNAQLLDTKTADLNGSTANITFAVVNNGGTMEFQVTNSGGVLAHMNILTRYIPTIF